MSGKMCIFAPQNPNTRNEMSKENTIQVSEFLQTLEDVQTKLSKKKGKKDSLSNEDYASVCSDPKAHDLTKGLCDLLDQEYAYRKELEKEKDPEAWFVRTVGEDAAQQDIEKVNEQLAEALEKLRVNKMEEGQGNE